MSGFNNDESFLNLMGFNNPNVGSSNPNAGSSSSQNPLPNPLGSPEDELHQQHQAFLLWQRNQQMLNTNFQNLQFGQPTQPPSQYSQFDTNDVSEAPIFPQKSTLGVAIRVGFGLSGWWV